MNWLQVLGDAEPPHIAERVGHQFHARLLLDSRVMDLTLPYNPIFVTISPLTPLFFNGFKNEQRFLDHMEG